MSANLSVAGQSASKALDHLLQARNDTVDPDELKRINLAITRVHEVVEPRSLPRDCPACEGTGMERSPAPDDTPAA